MSINVGNESLGLEQSVEFRPRCFSTDDPSVIEEARRLTARVYLQQGFISLDQINERQTIIDDADPYIPHSEYYVLMDENWNEIVATSRKIKFDEASGQKSFPLLDHEDSLDPVLFRKIEEVGLDKVIEISALAKDKNLDSDDLATLTIYKELFQNALRNSKDEKLFIMACNPALFRNFKQLFNGAMQQVGPALDYPGQIAIPAMFDLHDGPISVIEMSNDENDPKADSYKFIVEFMFKGLAKSEVDPDIVNALDSNGHENLLIDDLNSDDQMQDSINEGKKNFWKRRRPELISGLGLIAYTAARTAAVAKGLSPYSAVDWKVFLGIELATTPPYVWGVGDLIRSLKSPDDYSKKQKVVAAAMAGSTLLAPYAYIAAEGAGMPEQAWIGFFSVAALCLAIPARKLIKNIRNRTLKTNT